MLVGSGCCCCCGSYSDRFDGEVEVCITDVIVVVLFVLVAAVGVDISACLMKYTYSHS